MYSSVGPCYFKVLRNKPEDFDALTSFIFVGDSILVGSREAYMLSCMGSFPFYVKEDVFSSI